MKKDKKLITLFGTYSAILLIIIVIAITTVISKLPKSPEHITETFIETEYVYVNAGYFPEMTKAESSTSENGIFIVKEYENKIGIFNESGELIEVIDVYTKTLPNTDQRLLEEGITIYSRSELNAIIEDYSE